MTYSTYTDWALPDPQYKPEFYTDTALKRLIAWGIDTIIILVMCLLLLPFTAFTAVFFFPAFFLTVGFVYRTATITRSSATLGMRFMAIEFRTHRGATFDLNLAAIHSLAYTISTFTVVPQLISLVLMATTARGQGLTDLLLGTVAMNKRAGH